MSRILLSVLAATVALSAAAQVPVITSIEPSHGPSSGGTKVVVNGDNLATRVQCLLPCPPRVVFGDIAVDATEESDERLVVTTPAHAPGTVDVAVEIPGQPRVLVHDAFTFDGGPDAAYQQILLPIYLRNAVPGANGTQWKTDFYIRNDSTTEIRLAPWQCADNQACPPVFPLTYRLEAGKTLHNPVDFAKTPGTNPSRLLYVSSYGSVSMSLRVADISRTSLNAGTELPVITPDELLRGSAQLFNIPLTDQNFRVLLRIYEVAYNNSRFIVRFHPNDDASGLPPYTVVLNAYSPQEGAFRAEAAYVEFDVSALLNLRRTWPDTLRIEIEPVTPGSRYWAFASITNNQTQLVTLVTPQ